MVSKIILISAIVAYVEARFGQEQVPISAISAVQGGAPGAAATVAGAAISDLLGGANACAKLTRADQIVSELGGGADAIAAAIGMVTAEKNTNPFVDGNAQKVCNDPTLPATAELRGITPLIDPDVDVNGAAATLSKDTAAAPLNADGMSVFDLMVAKNLGDLVVAQNADGSAAAGGNNATAGNDNNDNNNNNDQQAANNQSGQDAQGAQGGSANDQAAADDSANACEADNAQDENSNDNNNNQNADQNANADQQAAGGNQAAAGNETAAAGGNGAAQQSSLAGADFGKCTPTIKFEGGQNGRPADEFTFQITDPVARGGQQEALNPNIITNALCNQLTNVCDANDAAKSACEDAKAQVQAAGTRDKSTADLFNSALGFAGAVTNPDGGPESPPAAAAAGNKRARSFRA